jgi:hypothetical protein
MKFIIIFQHIQDRQRFSLSRFAVCGSLAYAMFPLNINLVQHIDMLAVMTAVKIVC